VIAATDRIENAALCDGLIVELSPLKIPFFGSMCMDVRQFDMPLPVHLVWCASMDDGEPL